MCGIAGLWASRLRPAAELDSIASRMQRAIAHRGPDGHGIWADPEAGLALAHRRLAVIELSDAGAQPMTSASGRFILSFNGEIYNFEALRAELEGSGWKQPWRGGSDTEVLAAAFDHWGVQPTLPRLDGMFALAVWDRRDRRLVLARDRFGEKPLYYGMIGDMLLFGSELRSLAAASPEGLGPLDPNAIDHLVRELCIPAPLSVYRAVRKLPPASSLSMSPADLAVRQLPEPLAYWNAVESSVVAAADPFMGSAEEATQRLLELLERSVRLRLVADVPVGVMLSGGVDSSAVCAVAQAVSSRPLRTFTVGFDDPAYDEAPHAAAVAAALGTDHTTVTINQADLLATVIELPSLYDEPFADSSQLNMVALSRALRREVTVALSGDAGDELFGGYVRYRTGPRLWSMLESLPSPLRRASSWLVRHAGQSRVAHTLARATGARGEGIGRIDKALGLIDSRSDADLYHRLLSVWPRWAWPERAPSAEALPGLSTFSFRRRMMLADTIGYLPNDVLTKVDRATMSVALEARVPLLSPEIFSFAWSLADSHLFANGAGKRPLRGVAERFLPREILDRPKQGFAIPLAQWLRGPLRPWANDLLRNEQVSELGVLEAPMIRQAWDAHLSGRSDESARLWPVLMFEAWRIRQSGDHFAEAA